jgi:hypothetical protein
MEGKLCRAFSRGTDPDAAAKCLEIGEIFLVFGALGSRRVISALNREGVVDAKVQVKSTGQNFAARAPPSNMARRALPTV